MRVFDSAPDLKADTIDDFTKQLSELRFEKIGTRENSQEEDNRSAFGLILWQTRKLTRLTIYPSHCLN